MTESLGVGESVTVEVTRASPFSNVASAVTSTSATAPQIPGEYIVVIMGALVAIAFIFLAFRKHSKLKHDFSSRKFRLNMAETEHSLERMAHRKNRFVRSFGLAAIIGFVGIVLTGTGIVWALAAVVFYYEFFVRGGK